MSAAEKYSEGTLLYSDTESGSYADGEKLKGNWNGNILITRRVLIKVFPLFRCQPQRNSLPLSFSSRREFQFNLLMMI
jgi:hypothetical protein